MEAKFCVPSDISPLLLAGGGTLTRPASRLRDVYWDTRQAGLMARDLWLRQREGVWQLKLPGAGGASRQGGTTTYREVMEVGAIRALVKEVGVEQELEELERLVEVGCTREEWVVGEVVVVVDRMEDGYTVGEVEVVVGDSQGKEDARRKVDAMVARLGLQPQLEGKVEHCLRLQNPGAYRLLLQLRGRDED